MLRPHAYHARVLVGEHRAHLLRHVLALLRRDLLDQLRSAGDDLLVVGGLDLAQAAKEDRDDLEGLLGELLVRAKSIKSLCLFLHWGSLGGNTLNDSLSKLGEGGVTPFRLFYVTYYGPLFGVIAVMNAALPIMPRVPSALSAGVGVVLTFVGGSWLAPVGLAGLAFGKE